MTSISKNVYLDKLDDTVDQYNNTYHSTIKMKLVDVKSRTYIDFNKENNKGDPKYQVGDHIRKSIFKKYLQKAMIKIGQKKCL